MKRISIGYEIFDNTFVIKKVVYDDQDEQAIYQVKEYKKNDYKDNNNCLYNVVLDDFNLEFEINDDNFFMGLEEMCDNIVKRIKD